MKNIFLILSSIVALCMHPIYAQVPAGNDSEAASPSQPNTSASKAPGSSRQPSTPNFGSPQSPNSSSQASDTAGVREVLQGFDLRNSAFNWRGKSFDLGDTEMARARFEKYLNAPAATSAEDLKYDKILDDINKRLVGRGGGSESTRVAEAWRMLYQASEFRMDSGLSETLADRVISFWQTNKRIQSLLWENERLEKDREATEANMRVINNQDRREFIDMTRGTSGHDNPAPPSMDYKLDPERKRLEETEQKLEENRAYEVTSRMNQKLEFQSMILQFFIQRRFQHTLIANDFYRYIFSAEDNTLEGADALKGQVFGDLDVKITTSTVDALSKEAISDVHESIETVDFLLERGEIHMAAQRLMEAFYLGEYLPPVKTFSLDKKRVILDYMRNLSSLANALEVKNFDRARDFLGRITDSVQDFDPGKADAFIMTSKQLSNLAVQKALTAAYDQDRQGIEAALQEAVEYWPTNPEISKFSEKLLEKTDVKDMAALDFDRFQRQKDYRAIFNDRFRFAAALAMDEKRNEQFLEIMKRMEKIETAMGQAKELSRIKNNFGAWEVLERVYRLYPEDQDLNRMRGDFAIKASQFASAVSQAEDARRNGDYSKALMGYLKAKDLYPASYFAQEGIDLSVTELLKANAGLETTKVELAQQ